MPRGSSPDTAESLADLLAELPEDLQRQAFTHASWVEQRAESYERLAFLGDVVLSLAVSTHLYPRFERTSPAVVRSFAEEIDDALEHPVDYKSVLQERLARRAEVVVYKIDSEQGPAHDRSFVAVAEVAGQELGRGEGKTKKSAEQEAALRALDEIEN